MNFRKNISLIVTSSLLLTLASCGGDSNSSSKKQEQNSVCSEVDCLSSVNWKILLQGRTFPDKARVDINGTTVLNECVSKQKYEINRSAEPQELFLESFYVPKRGELKIQVVDLGDCNEVNSQNEEVPFISEENVNFEITKGANDVSEVVINL